jgi:hypothetical protein
MTALIHKRRVECRPYMVQQLAEAIRKAAAEHGRPNRLYPRELTQEYGGPDVRVIGRIGVFQMAELYTALGGREKWGSSPVYSHRSFLI